MRLIWIVLTGLIKFVGCSEADRKAIFLKFHKVGSGSVSACLRDSISKLSPNTYWKNQRSCGVDPFSHSLLYKYQSMQLSDCIESTKDINIIAILRDPLEKVISQLVFFNNEVNFLVSNVSNLRTTCQKILGDTHAVSATEMSALLTLIKSNSHVHSKFQSNIVLNEYEMVFSKNNTLPFRSSAISASEATHNMIRDVDTIGVLESLPSFFYLLSSHLNTALPCHCLEDHSHGIGKRNKQYFASPTR